MNKSVDNLVEEAEALAKSSVALLTLARLTDDIMSISSARQSDMLADAVVEALRTTPAIGSEAVAFDFTDSLLAVLQTKAVAQLRAGVQAIKNQKAAE